MSRVSSLPSAMQQSGAQIHHPPRISCWAVGATYLAWPICLAGSPLPPRREVPSLEQRRPGEHKIMRCMIAVDLGLKMSEQEGANIPLPSRQG